MFRSFEGRPVRPYSDLSAIARDGLERGVDHLCVWDYTLLGDYSKVDDVPRHGFDEAARRELSAALQGARSLGAHVSALENFRLAKAGSALWAEYASEEACRRYDGTPFVEEYSSSGAHGPVIVSHVGPGVHPVDARGPRHRRRVLSLVRDSLDLGFDSIFYDQPFENWPSYAALRGADGPDGAHAAVVSLLAEVRELVRQGSPEGIVVGEYCDIFAAPYVDAWMSWYTDLDDLERAAYSIPRTLQTIVVDSDPALATRGFLVSAQLCLTTHGCEGTLADEPAFARHVAGLARLRRRLSEEVGSWRYIGGAGLDASCDGPASAAAFSSAPGPFVICASPGAPGRLRVLLDPESFGVAGAQGLVVHRLDGSADRLRGRDSFELALGANEVAIVRPSGA